MKLSMLNGLCGGGGGKSSSKSGLIGFQAARSVGNNVAITGSIVILLVGSFVQDCGGKPFHVQGGQAEVEEDTTQGSLKEKFPPAGALMFSSSAGGNPHSILDEGDSDQDDNEDDSGVIGLLPLGTQNDATQRWIDEGTFARHGTHASNYGAVVHKRSLGGGRSSYSLDDGGGDEEYQRLRSFTTHNNRPMYFEQSGVATVGSEVPAGGNNIRQKLMSLRNQYGDKWYSYVGPYAYRKRQILYRQCFFNPISCF